MPSEMSQRTLALGDAIRPLTDAEERAATDAAFRLLSNELSARRRAFGVELRIPKVDQAAATPRYFSVIIADYDKRRTLEVVVDSAGKLISNTDLTGFQPPIVSDEVA